MIENYRGIIPQSELSDIERLARALKGRSLKHINSTAHGGGVAELLTRLVPLARSVGIDASWEVIEGRPEFFEVTKAFHNALQGSEEELPPLSFEIYLDNLRAQAQRITFDTDVTMVHDPQPLYLLNYVGRNSTFPIWRCHIDVSHPNERVWRFLSQGLLRYKMAVFHVPEFARRLPIPQVVLAPSIDPLSDKNRELSEAEITAVTDRFGIDRKRPLLVQVSRFDRFKDPLGVIRAYRMVRQTFDCQLVLVGGGAQDDPEGGKVLEEVREASAGDPDIFVLELPANSDIEINALQRAATVILQKSTREGFGLTVTEGMWKGKPVIGGAVGGIPSQIIHGVNGFLVHSPEGAAFRLRFLLSHPRAAERMGASGREHVRRHFLITRHLRDHLLLMLVAVRGGMEPRPILLES